MNYFQLFFQSNMLEMPVYLLFLKMVRKDWSLFCDFVFITGLNAITHPIVFFFIMNFKLTYLENIMIAESFAITTEALILYGVLKEKIWICFLVSVFANFLSWQLSPMMTWALN